MKYIKTLVALFVLIPSITYASFGATWNATSSTAVEVQPGRINGVEQAVKSDHFIATSTTASTFPYASSTLITARALYANDGAGHTGIIGSPSPFGSGIMIQSTSGLTNGGFIGFDDINGGELFLNLDVSGCAGANITGAGGFGFGAGCGGAQLLGSPAGDFTFNNVNSFNINTFTSGSLIVFDDATGQINFGEPATASLHINEVTPRMDVNTNFGIFNTIPAYPLDIIGDANVTGCYRMSGTCLSLGGGSYPFIPTLNYGVTNQATSGILWFQNGLNASSTSHFDYATTTMISSTIASILTLSSTGITATNSTTTNATTTNLSSTNLVSTNGTIAGFNSTNSTSTNATATNFFSTNGTFTSLRATTGTIVGLISTNSTTTNATSSNLSSTNFTTTNASTSILYISSLGIPAGTFLATDSTGKVIATTTPASGGALSGGITNFMAYWTSASTLSATSAPTVQYLTATSTSIASKFFIASTTLITASSSAYLAINNGAVSIGTSSPLSGVKLDVFGNINLSGASRTISGSNSSAIGGTVGSNVTITGGSGGSSNAGTIVANGGNGGTGGDVTITSGMGTTLAGNVSLVGVSGANGGGVNITSGSGVSGANITLNVGSGSTNGNIILFSNSTVGKVGIATTSPYSLLSVGGQVVAANYIATTSSFSTYAGSVGIGTTSPFSMLSVAGQGVFQNILATSTTATSSFSGPVAVTGRTTFATTTSSGMINVGTTNNLVSGTSTVFMSNIQFDGYNSAHVRVCAFISAANAWVISAGKCANP